MTTKAVGLAPELFTRIRDSMDAHQDCRERINKLSRDITQQSKKLIFHLLRVSPTNRAAIFQEAERKHADILRAVAQIAPELQGSNRWRYGSTFTGGLQEYIEALALWVFLAEQRLITLAEVESRLNEFSKAQIVHIPVGPIDYVLGVSDVAGELMRYAINSLACGNADEANAVGVFFQQLYSAFVEFNPRLHPQMTKKVQVMRDSLLKVENACYQSQLQVSEFPASRRPPVLDLDQPSAEARSDEF
ncbi:Translin [Dimargaris cristalligena]|uniref:Translin n=1 Tax=Dimargaris cristalligena TaxID=215637 RepID=A0A4V1J5I3_9FUNG|nr:Translin [Dimargaris cristalligena]|eukprot:RKP39159.1 Translin [Dimargaris cristalligena]